MSDIQSVIFDKNKISIAKAREFLKENSFEPIKTVDETLNFFRFRIRPPDIFKRFRLIPAGKRKDIKFVIGFK